ncbi:1-acyl-sn-glycerol-3-phosphate acyltransferase [Geitlerinema sp. PCC 9228]|jgi:1-acyl-sn-glycerol-3-phosphate acyltransferase|uniref:1-acyl-sn-glycerol-3-phosphate acyltransferase n=1 Tax=Geitlerinema sp. PCC 9228 TaxID=111611 RepID=UPI0008F9E475|nr:1-acyl-sn-glycerol-3-phosphate acyltransferase [Geitlerinema sp. PCC 9228]
MTFSTYQPESLLDKRDPEMIQSMLPFWEFLYHLYFRVETDGWHHIPERGSVLFVGSHNGGLAAPDMHMFLVDWYRRFGVQRNAYGLMQREVLTSPDAAASAARMGALPAEPRIAAAALRRGAPVLVYPGGIDDVFRPYSQRHRIELAGRKGFIKLALRENVPIIPLVSLGAHETLMVLTDCKDLMGVLRQQGLIDASTPITRVFPIYLGLPWGLAAGAAPNIPLPRKIYTRVCSPIDFERSGRKAARDRKYVDACYEQVRQHMQAALDDLVVRSREGG